MKFITLKSYDPKVGTTINFEIYIKTSEVKVLLLFKVGTVFSQEDVERCKKYTAMNCLCIKEDDYLALFQEDTEHILASLENGGTLDTQAGSKIAQNFFKSEALLSGDNKIESMTKMANTYVTELLKSSKDQRTQALVGILKGLVDSTDEFVTHANQVAGVSTMIAMMVEGVTLDNIVEINLVSILHGMGLMVMSHRENQFFNSYADFSSFKELVGKTDQVVLKKVIDKHFDGHNKLTTSDNVIFLQHLSLIEQNLDKIKIKNIKTAGLVKTIGDFKKILVVSTESTHEANPYVSAKILVIGDRLVSLLNFYRQNPTFIESAVRDLQQLNDQPKPIFDKKIIDKVSQLAL